MKGKYTPVIVFVLAGLAVLLVPLPPVVKGLLYKTYNLVLFCYIIYRAAAPAVKTFFVERKKRVERYIAEAQAAKEQAEKLLHSYEQKVKMLEQEKDMILARYKEEGSRERAIIIEEAHREAEKIIQQAQDMMRNEARRAQLVLREEIISESLRLSETLLRQQYNKDDQKRAIDEALVRVKDLRS